MLVYIAGMGCLKNLHKKRKKMKETVGVNHSIIQDLDASDIIQDDWQMCT